MLEKISKADEIWELIGRISHLILNPLETLNKAVELSLIYIPALLVVIFIFYIVTQSEKIIRVFCLVLVFFIFIKFALVFDFTWLIIVILIAILIIRFLGVVM